MAYTHECTSLKAAVVKLCAESWQEVQGTQGYEVLPEGARLVLEKRVKQERSAEEADLRLARHEQAMRPSGIGQLQGGRG